MGNIFQEVEHLKIYRLLKSNTMPFLCMNMKHVHVQHTWGQHEYMGILDQVRAKYDQPSMIGSILFFLKSGTKRMPRKLNAFSFHIFKEKELFKVPLFKYSKLKVKTEAPFLSVLYWHCGSCHFDKCRFQWFQIVHNGSFAS